MIAFDFPEKGTFGRPLKLGSQGWGVYALQTALGLQPDGVFGAATDKAARELQADHGLTVDGIVGYLTKRVVALENLWPHQRQYRTLPGLVRGMLEGESGFACDAQSPVYSVDHGRVADLGVVQWQTLLADQAAVLQHINVPHALERICGDQDRGMRPRHDKYLVAKWVRAQPEKEKLAWWLAVASWNAPSWADAWAALGPGSLSHDQQAHLVGYVEPKIVYAKEWS